MSWKIPLSDIEFGPEEEEAVLAVLKSRWLTMGAVTGKFEDQFAEYNDVPHAVAVSNCTAALHLACLALEIGPGDEVITPALTFVATANAIRYTGATPVFADINGGSDLNISVDSIRSRITDKTKAIMVMHYAGYACDMHAICTLAAEHGLAVIEDAAHSVGGSLEGKKLGTWGDIGCYSFFSNKNLVTGEGGMMVTARNDLAERVKRLRSHGMTSLTWDRHKGHAWSYDVVDLGYNYRLDEIRSALGLAQLSKLVAHNQARLKLAEHYRQQIGEIVPEVDVPFSGHPGEGTAHIMPVLLPPGVDKKSVMDSMKTAGIQTSFHYPPVYSFSSYRQLGFTGEGLPNTEQAAKRELTLPMYASLEMAQVDAVVKELVKALENTV